MYEFKRDTSLLQDSGNLHGTIETGYLIITSAALHLSLRQTLMVDMKFLCYDHMQC